MQNTGLVVTTTLCVTGGGVRISTKNSCPASKGMNVLACGQGTIILTFEKEDYYV